MKKRILSLLIACSLMTGMSFCAISLEKKYSEIFSLAKKSGTGNLYRIDKLKSIVMNAPDSFWKKKTGIPRKTRAFRVQKYICGLAKKVAKSTGSTLNKYNELLKLAKKHQYLKEFDANFNKALQLAKKRSGVYAREYGELKKTTRRYKIQITTINKLKKIIDEAPKEFWTKKVGKIIKKPRRYDFQKFICGIAKEVALSPENIQNKYIATLNAAKKHSHLKAKAFVKNFNNAIAIVKRFDLKLKRAKGTIGFEKELDQIIKIIPEAPDEFWTKKVGFIKKRSRAFKFQKYLSELAGRLIYVYDVPPSSKREQAFLAKYKRSAEQRKQSIKQFEKIKKKYIKALQQASRHKIFKKYATNFKKSIKGIQKGGEILYAERYYEIKDNKSIYVQDRIFRLSDIIKNAPTEFWTKKVGKIIKKPRRHDFQKYIRGLAKRVSRSDKTTISDYKKLIEAASKHPQLKRYKKYFDKTIN
jgi:G:T-mismatch repair DNA endonuclease (very short patch repair protein)